MSTIDEIAQLLAAGAQKLAAEDRERLKGLIESLYSNGPALAIINSRQGHMLRKVLQEVEFRV